jgi:hypothetical protein
MQVSYFETGRIINPLIVEGQVRGGLVQGIGQALYEDTIYDLESGQLRTALAPASRRQSSERSTWPLMPHCARTTRWAPRAVARRARSALRQFSCFVALANHWIAERPRRCRVDASLVDPVVLSR